MPAATGQSGLQRVRCPAVDPVLNVDPPEAGLSEPFPQREVARGLPAPTVLQVAAVREEHDHRLRAARSPLLVEGLQNGAGDGEGLARRAVAPVRLQNLGPRRVRRCVREVAEQAQARW